MYNIENLYQDISLLVYEVIIIAGHSLQCIHLINMVPSKLANERPMGPYYRAVDIYKVTAVPNGSQ